MVQEWQPSEAEMREVDHMWEMWDTDGNGSLDEFEFVVVLKSLGVDDRSEVTGYYSEIDTEKLGEISKEQFKQWFLVGPKPKEEPRESYASMELEPVVEEAEEAEGGSSSDADGSSDDEHSDHEPPAELSTEPEDEFSFGRKQGLDLLPEMMRPRY